MASSADTVGAAACVRVVARAAGAAVSSSVCVVPLLWGPATAGHCPSCNELARAACRLLLIAAPAPSGCAAL